MTEDTVRLLVAGLYGIVCRATSALPMNPGVAASDGARFCEALYEYLERTSRGGRAPVDNPPPQAVESQPASSHYPSGLTGG